MTLDIAIEGVLFYRAAPVKKSEIIKLFGCQEVDLEEALKVLHKRLQNGATRLLQTESQIQIVTAPELDELIETMRKDERKRDIGKAGAETLAIILYKGQATRAEIDRIRGVNSSFILRNLMVRGLIERGNETNSRVFIITPDLLAHLGVTNCTELPNYATVLDQLEKFEAAETAEENI